MAIRGLNPSNLYSLRTKIVVRFAKQVHFYQEKLIFFHRLKELIEIYKIVKKYLYFYDYFFSYRFAVRTYILRCREYKRT